MKLVDVHAHLDHTRFEKDLDEVIKKFKKAGGKYIISSGTSPITNRKVLEIAEKYDIVKCSFGMYPVGNFDENIDAEIKWIEKHASSCVAIGEIGLDYNDDKRKAEAGMQKELFRKMLNLAKEIDKPVVIHSRKAELDAIEILEEMDFAVPKGTPPAQMASAIADKVGVIMHCFCGKKSLIRRCVENGWSFSVPPVIARLEHFRMLVEMVPMDQLLTETDAPYLPPIIGERNESVNVMTTIKIIAEIKEMEGEEVAEKIYKNAIELFGLRKV